MFVEAKRTMVATTAFRPMPKIAAILSCLVMVCTSLNCVLTSLLINYLDSNYTDWKIKGRLEDESFNLNLSLDKLKTAKSPLAMPWGLVVEGKKGAMSICCLYSSALLRKSAISLLL